MALDLAIFFNHDYYVEWTRDCNEWDREGMSRQIN